MSDRNRNIPVLQKHIDEGVRESSIKCMGVEAIKDAIPDAHHVFVDMQTCRYTDGKGVRRTWLTPGPLQAALVRYDAGDEVKPFRFSLNSLLHVNKATPNVRGSADRIKKEKLEIAPRARIGGKPVPVIQNSTRRRFGIRNLRINQQGEVVQQGVIDDQTR
jgi:hypothetical protein